MRAPQETATRSLLATLIWHPVDTGIAESAAGLGQHWLPSHRFIDGADLAIAATVLRADAHLLTRNVRHFPMFTGLNSPYWGDDGNLRGRTGAASGHGRSSRSASGIPVPRRRCPRADAVLGLGCHGPPDPVAAHRVSPDSGDPRSDALTRFMAAARPSVMIVSTASAASSMATSRTARSAAPGRFST